MFFITHCFVLGFFSRVEHSANCCHCLNPVNPLFQIQNSFLWPAWGCATYRPFFLFFCCHVCHEGSRSGFTSAKSITFLSSAVSGENKRIGTNLIIKLLFLLNKACYGRSTPWWSAATPHMNIWWHTLCRVCIFAVVSKLHIIFLMYVWYVVIH